MAAKDLRMPYTEQGDIAIEHQLTRDLGVTANYIWSRGLHLTSVTDVNAGLPTGDPVTYRINDVNGQQVSTYTTRTYRKAGRPNQAWNQLNVVDAGNKSYYNAFALQVRKRASHGVEGSLSYTWSHAIDTVGFFNGGNNNIFYSGGPGSYFPGDVNGEKGSSALDQRHRLTINSTWMPVFTKSDSVGARYFLNNWQLSILGVFASASPAQQLITISGQPFVGSGLQAPQSNSGLNGYSLSRRPPFEGLNSLDLDQRATLDARISKIVPFSERLKLTLSFEAFNIMNHTYITGRIADKWVLSGNTTATPVLTPYARYAEANQAQGFPDGTNSRRAQVSARLVW
jgi:hypothetical protein